MRSRLVAFIRNNLSMGNRLSEFFYGVTMVVMFTGIINAGMPPTQATLRILLVGALVINISWGVIDGVTSMYGGLANRADYLRTVNELRRDPADPEKREAVSRAMQGTIVENLDPADQGPIVDALASGVPVTGKRFPPTRDDWNIAIATILIDFALVFPVIVPYFIIDNVREAVFISHLIAIVLLAGLAMFWARNLNLNIRKAGIIIAIIAFIAIYISYTIGW